MSDIKLALETLTDRRDTYDTANSYYSGSESEVFAGVKWGKIFRSRGLDYVLNYAKTVVDTVNDRLEIAAVIGTDDASNAAIEKIWEKNELVLDSQEIHRRALVYGECYAIVWPDEQGEVQITYNSPTTTIMIYDEENPRVKSYAAKMWQTKDVFGKPVIKLNLYYADRVEKYSRDGEVNAVTATDARTWNQLETVDNPFGEVPVFHFRTHRPYGTPEHAAAIGPQDAINKIVINHMETIDYHGAPQRYALASYGSGAEMEDFSEDDTARENIGALKSGPGELWYLNGVTQVGQFAAADYKTFTEPIMSYVQSMASLTNTPLHYFKATQIVSGEAFRMAESPLIKKVKDRQISFGSTWRELFRFALKIEGIDTDVQVNWQGTESTDAAAQWTIAGLKRALGIPMKRVLTEMGYDGEVAQEIVDEIEEEAEKQRKLAEEGGGAVPGGTTTATQLSSGMNAHNMQVQAEAARAKQAQQQSAQAAQ